MNFILHPSPGFLILHLASLNAGVCALLVRHRGVAYARQEALLLGAAAAARALSMSEDIVQVGIQTARSVGSVGSAALRSCW